MKTQILTYFTALLFSSAIAQAAHHASAKAGENCVDGLIDPYFATQTALAADNLDDAKSAAKTLLAAQTQNPCANEVGEATQTILKTDSIDEARVAFKTISDALIILVEENGAGSGEIHLVHCPMAFEFSGASWLQKNKSVANPYFGSQMFSCGAVEQSFGQVQKSE